jgi:hypothetical protein
MDGTDLDALQGKHYVFPVIDIPTVLRFPTKT